MSNNISINSGAQQVAANSASPVKQSGKSGQADGKFAEHLVDAKVEGNASNGLKGGEEATIEIELPGEDAQLAETLTQEIEMPEIEVPETGAVDVELQEISLDDLEIPIKNGKTAQVDLKPEAGEVVETVKETVVPVGVASAEVGKDVNAAKSQSEGAVTKPIAAANAKTVMGRRENPKVDQGEVETRGQAIGDADDGLETTKPVRTMERPLERTVGRGRANGVIQSKVDGERGINPEQAANKNGAVKTERAANSAPGPASNPASSAFGVRRAEGRLASMIEASGAFDGDVKINVVKQENHVLPALPQQLSVTGMSRTVVSQVLELRRSGELEMTGLDVKTGANKPVKVIEVQLMPRNLGTVGITIRNVAGRINISIEVQGAEAERLIKTEVDKIAGAIRQAGQVVEDITIKRGVQMSQQSDSLNDDRGADRHGEANFGQNSNNLMRQSSREETDGASDRQRFDEIGVQEHGEIAASSDKAARQGIYL